MLIVAAIEQIIIYPIIISYMKVVDKKKLEIISKVTYGIPAVGNIMRLLIDYTRIFAR